MVTDSIAFIRSSLAVIFMGFLLVIVKRQIGDTSLSRHYKEGTFRNEVVFTLQQNVHKVLPHSFFFSPSAFVVLGHILRYSTSISLNASCQRCHDRR